MNWKTFFKERQGAILSGIVAIVIIVGAFLAINASNKNNQTDTNKDKPTTQEQENQTGNVEGENMQLPASYTVVRGDSLWKISKKFYNDGLNWPFIASENKLANPNVIHAGNVLTVPKLEAVGGADNLPKTGVSPNSYVVQKGDNLWNIAIKHYGSGYQWYKIRDANKDSVGTLSNGRPLIVPGQNLAIPK